MHQPNNRIAKWVTQFFTQCKGAAYTSKTNIKASPSLSKTNGTARQKPKQNKTK